jgi:glycosyltransferase involved in cell wall biosynthesis
MGERQRPQRALFVDDCWPRRDRDAGSNAVLSHVAALQALGWSVDFVASRELARGNDDAAALAASGVTCHRWPKITSVEEVLRRNRGLFDLVYLHRLSNAETYAAMVRNWLPQARVLYSVADLHHVRLARQARVQASQELLQESQRLKRRELLAMRWADAVITHSTDEAAYLAREVPGARVHVVPWDVTPGRARKPLHHRAGIAFIGGYRHAPNPDAVQWLVETIMPLVWQRHPTLRCFVVGSGWPEQPRRATDPRLRFVGPVPRLDEVFDMVRLTVAPLRFGAGLKGKVLDSLAAGVPCVMTPIAAEGLGLPPALAGLVTDDAARFAALIGDLHERSALNQDHAAAGQEFVRQRFDAATVQRELARALSVDAMITRYAMTA